MDNGKNVTARIPQPIAGPKYYMTASEVATMDFVRSVVQIPASRVLAWSADANNPVRSEYIVMEEATGEKLEDVWDDFSLERRIAVMKELVFLQKKTGLHIFQEVWPYGNLYFASEEIPGTVAAEVTGDMLADVRSAVMRRFAIGPVTDRAYWHKERAEMDIDRGPWKYPRDYAVSLAHCHALLLQRYLKVAPYLLPADNSVVASHLWHTDLHAANIFVKDGRISSIIDWQGTWAITFDTPSPPPATGGIAKEVSVLDKAVRVNHGRTRCDPIRFVGDTWEDDILPLRESLIGVEKYWNELGVDIPCPIHFTDEELRFHEEDGEGWNDAQDFWDSVSMIISRDGWMPNKPYEEVRLNCSRN
ncbi:uncharacterized protein BJX67DRAFT_391106 [Aspergillus lucknowensis]|uniref:Altered inheritance of mitochondria protein 9, mitochondrial n=1 Tax=Aspergillus lucknowensis TaxID=176173 RepID=A0ABR4LE77_9EURO